METTFLKSTRGDVQIAVAWSVPDAAVFPAPKGIIQIVHGMCEHKERYFPLMAFLCEKGFVVVAHDHRGHGASVTRPEDLGFMGKDGWLAMVDDTKSVTDWIRARFSSLPLTLFGHSMGSLVVRSFAKRYDAAIDSLIVCGCPSDNPVKGAGMAICRVTGALRGWHHRPDLMQKLSLGAYDKPFANEGPNAWVCSDQETLAAYRADPLCQYVFTADGFLNLLLLMKDCYDPKGWALSKPGLPVHFISGAEDPCRVDDRALEKAVELMRQVGYRDVSLKLYPGMRHEIHNETGRQQVWDDILSYACQAL